MLHVTTLKLVVMYIQNFFHYHCSYFNDILLIRQLCLKMAIEILQAHLEFNGLMGLDL